LIVRDLGRQTGRLKEQGLTIPLCEQNAKFAAEFSDRAYILEKGHVRFSGSIEAPHGNDEVRRQYLGL
jgi:branched-chain amino acid transport system ATP-binding protein